MVRRVLSQTTAQHVSRPVLFAPSRMIDAEETTNTTTERFSSTVTELWDSTKMQESNYPNHRGTSLVSFGSAFDETKRETAMPASVGARGETKQDKGAFQQCILEATQIASFGTEKTRAQPIFVHSASTNGVWFRNASSTVLDHGTLAMVMDCYMNHPNHPKWTLFLMVCSNCTGAGLGLRSSDIMPYNQSSRLFTFLKNIPRQKGARFGEV